MSRFYLPTALSIVSIGMTPMVSCNATTSAISSTKDNETVDITFQNMNDIIGHGHTVEGAQTADTTKDYRCRFISATYEMPDGMVIPTHKQLKTKDLEVICNNVNIISLCSLKNNVLIIPANQLKGDITINLMGAEIADWVAWDTISEISDKEIQDRHSTVEHKTLAKDYFQVGDYKMCKEGAKDIGYATIIGFDQQDYAYVDGKKVKYEASPFTFEILNPIDKHKWGNGSATTGRYDIPAWEGDTCQLSYFGTQLSLNGTYGFSPRSVNLNTSNSTFSYFYVLSLYDQLGTSCPGEVQDQDGGIKIDDTTTNEARYSYYKLNEYQSFELNHAVKRVMRSKTRWVRDSTQYVDRFSHEIPFLERMEIIFHTDFPDQYYWIYRDVEHEYYSSWAFCL